MRHPVTRYVIAAAVVLAAVGGFCLFHRTSEVAWALEESIQALNKYAGMVVEGMDSDRTWEEDGSTEMRPLKMWAAANSEQTAIEKARIEVEGVRVLVTNGQKTWRYDPRTNTVHIESRPYVASECWLGGRFLEQLNGFLEAAVLTHYETTYGKDAVTGQPRMILTCAWLDKRYNGPRSLWIEFDPNSKLPVSLKQWENAGREGPPTSVAEKITYYESLPDSLFEFEIPPGATLVGE